MPNTAGAAAGQPRIRCKREGKEALCANLALLRTLPFNHHLEWPLIVPTFLEEEIR
jgi:hypothetical protein